VDAERDRARPGLDPQFLPGRAGAAVEFVRDLPVEPDPELRPAGDFGEGRILRVAEREPAEDPGPLDRVLRGDHAELEEPVIRARLGEGLDPAEDRADVRGEHARDPALEEALAVDLDGRPHSPRADALQPGVQVRRAA
jgi:hypothetical protein